MKRTVFGAGLLLVLLAICLLTQSCMEAIHEPTVKLLEKAGQFAMADNWEEAETAFDQAQNQWQKNRKLTASVADHAPMEDVEGLFAQLEIFAARRETTHFAALCRELAGRVEAMADAHASAWWNLL